MNKLLAWIFGIGGGYLGFYVLVGPKGAANPDYIGAGAEGFGRFIAALVIWFLTILLVRFIMDTLKK
jgi:hypothetical protein